MSEKTTPPLQAAFIVRIQIEESGQGRPSLIVHVLAARNEESVYLRSLDKIPEALRCLLEGQLYRGGLK